MFYLFKNLINLYNILVKINKILFLDFNINLIKYLIISKLVYEIFIKDYLNKNKSIFLINKKDIYKNIKSDNYKNITKVYKSNKKNLLYIYLALNNMLSLECYKLEYINIKKDIDKLFRFFYYDIEIDKNNYLNVLLVITNASNICFLDK